MDNSTLLYIGMFCFAMMGIGMGLTVYEFKKMSPLTQKPSHVGEKFKVSPKASPSLRAANIVEL